MPRPLRRPVRFSLCLATDESNMLRQLANAEGEDQADLLRRTIRAVYKERFGSAPAAAAEAPAQ